MSFKVGDIVKISDEGNIKWLRWGGVSLPLYYFRKIMTIEKDGRYHITNSTGLWTDEQLIAATPLEAIIYF